MATGQQRVPTILFVVVLRNVKGFMGCEVSEVSNSKLELYRHFRC